MYSKKQKLFKQQEPDVESYSSGSHHEHEILLSVINLSNIDQK